MSSPVGHEPKSAEPEETQLAAVPASAEGPSEDDRVPRKLLLAALAALLLFAIGFAVQSGRVGNFQEQIGELEGEISGLSSELSATRQRVAAFELERAEVRQAVSQLRESVLGLAALVAEPTPGGATAVDPQPVETPVAEPLSSQAP